MTTIENGKMKREPDCPACAEPHQDGQECQQKSWAEFREYLPMYCGSRVEVIMSSEVQADWCAEYVKAREALADMMKRAGLTTGNGETFDGLLSEAEWQIERLQRIAGERYAPPPH